MKAAAWLPHSKAPAAHNRSGQSRLALNATGARYPLYRNFSNAT